MEKIKKVIDFSNQIKSFKENGPYTIAFCYPMNGKNFIVKGGDNEVNGYLKSLTIPTLVNKTYWSGGVCRCGASFYFYGTKNIYVSELYETHKKKNKKYEFRMYCKDDVKTFMVRKVPKCFPEQIKELIEKGQIETILGCYKKTKIDHHKISMANVLKNILDFK